MNLLKKLVPPPFRTERKVYRRARLILKIDLIIFLVSLLLIPFYYWIGFNSGVLVMIFSLICAITFPVLMNKTENLALSGHFFAFASSTVFFSLISLTGGIHSPYFVWLLTFPPITILYMEQKTAIHWLIMLGTLTLTIFGLEIVGYPLPNYQPKTWFAPTLLFSFSMVSLICVSVVLLFLNGFRSFNKKLKSSNENLQQSNKELERFAYIASHDLKSPLRNIVSFVNLIERRYGHQFDKNGNDYFNIIKTNARQMHHLVEDILEYSQTNNKELRKETVDLTKILLEIATQLQLNEKYVPSEVLFDEIPLLHADPATIGQLFQNLIENGLKYNDKPNRMVKVEFIKQKSRVYFKVSDNGIGIDEEYKNSIFEMFKRLHNQDTYKGTGIGLAICKKIVDLYEGKIWVTSKAGKGSTFHIVFPDSMVIESEVLEEELVGAL